MPPTGGKSKGKGRDRSRNTTPISTGSADQASSTATPAQMSYEDLLDRYCRSSSPPSSATLKKLAESLRTFSDLAKMRSDICDRGMRETSKKLKEARELSRIEEMQEREAEDEKRNRKAKPKKEREEERPMAVGARTTTRQDGLEDEEDSKHPVSPSLAPKQGLSPSHEHSPASPARSDSSMDSHQPRPAPAIPQYQTFGPDPSMFDDPTTYHIREVDQGITEEEKKDILQVADYPHDDLHDLTPGTPPDRDFSNAKPPNQVSATVFANYLEPYVRPLAEEDLAFLKERGDRTTPFLIPPRGRRSYREIWAEEDSSIVNVGDPQEQNPIQASGSMEQMNDEVAETSQISLGPMLTRLLQTLRPISRAPPPEANTTNGVNGDTSIAADGDLIAEAPGDDQASRPSLPATHLSEPNQLGNKASGTKMGYKETEDRLKQELRYIGFLPEDAEPEYESHNDDEVAARLRYLQEELRRVSIVNGARKARVLELADERMAQQEYSTIADDLDTQLNQAYLKRHRNIGKGKNKLKRAGAASAGNNTTAGNTGISKPGVGEPIRSLMERRRMWNDLIGPVVEHGKTAMPKDTIFDPESMARLLAKEREDWQETQD